MPANQLPHQLIRVPENFAVTQGQQPTSQTSMLSLSQKKKNHPMGRKLDPANFLQLILKAQ